MGPTALKRHDHACWSYATDEERTTVLADFFAAGIAARERLFYFGTDDTRPTALVGLAATGGDVTELIAAGRLVVADVEAAYFPDGAFDATANLEGFRALAAQALADGYLGIRVAAENAAVLNNPLIRDSWFPYEMQVDALVAAEPIVGLCSFDRRACDTETLALLDAVHLRQVDPTDSAPKSSFHLHTPREDVLVLTGEVDRFAVPALKRLLGGSVQEHEQLRIDVRGLSFLDSAAMRALEELADDRPATHRPLELQGISAFQHKAWTLSGHPERLVLVSE